MFSYLARMFGLSASLPRSGREVADTLRQLRVGEPTGFLADDFIQIPISDPALERIRERFARLAEGCPEWEPQAPFPPARLNELDALIAEAEALSVARAAERVAVGLMAEDYLAGRLSYADFMRAVPDQTQDEDAAELVDVIEHEPNKGGFFGVRPEEYDQHRERIRELARSITRPEAGG